MPAEATATSLPFQEAIDYFDAKLRLPTKAWTDLREGQHARGFVIAGAEKDELLADFQSALSRMQKEGLTLPDFRKDFDRIVEKHGWDYKGGRNWRSRVIYDTNLRMARAAGRWAQIQQHKKDFPFLRYVAVLDDKTRPDHRLWHGIILPVDHWWWAMHYPPNGWYCRCTVEQLSQRDLDRFGYRVSAKPLRPEMVEHTIMTSAGPTTMSAPKGIAPGFAYNVGTAAWGNRIDDATMKAWREQGAAAWERLTPGDWRSAGRLETIPVDTPTAKVGPPASDQAEVERHIENAIGGTEATFSMPDGSAVTVGAAALAGHIPVDRAPFVALIPELLRDPFEIWLSFERHKGTGRVALRKRVVKVVQLARDRALILTAQSVGGRLEAWTFLPARNFGYVQAQRVGKLLFGRDGGPK